MGCGLAVTQETQIPCPLDATHLRAYVELLSRAGRTLESSIQGSSMGETIPNGSRICIERTDGNNYRPGQIVACLEHGLLFAHRVVHVGRDAVITQGDGWILCDPPLPVSQVIGEVISYRTTGDWHLPASKAARSLPDARSARRQVRIIAVCLRVNLTFARFIARQLIRLDIFRKCCRKWYASSRQRVRG
jgi:hypothetical protein